MDEIIKRLSEATEGSREMDYAIVRRLFPEAGEPYHEPGYDEPYFYHAPLRKKPAPRYTTSLDAALKLIPTGWCLHRLKDEGGFWCAELLRRGPFDDKRVMADRATPALALCIAALRARAALSKTEGEKR